MGYQTQHKKCNICGGITITTMISYLMLHRKVIVSTNCKCKKNGNKRK